MEVYNISYIKEICCQDEEAIQEIKQLFLKQIPALLGQIDIGLQANDGLLIAFNAHKLKATVKTFQINTIYDQVLSLEKQAKESKDVKELLPLIEPIKETLTLAIEQLQGDVR